MTEEELMNSKVSMAEKQYGPAPGIDLSKIKNTKAAKIEKGSAKPHKDKVAKIKRAQVEEIANIKMKDLNASSLDSAVSMIKGTARSMGIVVED